jgi:ATP-dependent helicase/nuclease subunit B
MACIYEAFNDYLQSRYIDTDDYFNLFIEQAEQSALLRNCRMWIDSFTTFSPQTLKIINRLMGIVPEITIGITMDAAAISRDRDLFAPSRWSWQRISAMASDQGVREEYIHISDEEQWVPRQAEIRFLERELYAYPASSFSGQTKNLHLTVAANPYTEVENVAVQIINLAREQGYRWREIAVVNNAPDIYGHLIARVFSEYGIPFFMDQKKDIMNHPVVQLILYSLAIIHKGYRYEDVFAYLKTGFTNLKAPEYERLENYALQYGIKGKKWKELFRLGENNEEVEDLNRCRDKFVTPLEKLESDLQGAKSFQDITVAILAYLEQLQVEERLKAHIAIQTEQNQYNLVWENTQIWNIVMGVFQQMQEILGDQTGSLKEYRRVLEAGLLSYQLGIIPTTVDQILAGSVNRSISHDVRAMFVLGINDGVLPAGKLREGIISDAERQYLNEAGLQLGPDQQRRAAEERLLIYSIMSKPSSYLGISYALADEEGKALRPSLLVNRIKKLFPQLSVVSELETKFLASWQLIATRKAVLNILLKIFAAIWMDIRRITAGGTLTPGIIPMRNGKPGWNCCARPGCIPIRLMPWAL